MKISNNIDKPCVIMTGFTSRQPCFLKPLFRLSTQGCRIAMLERIQLVIAWLYNSLNDVGLTFKSKYDRKKHVFNFHQSDVSLDLNGVHCGLEISASGNYTCVLCKVECKGYEILTRHFKRYHTNIQINKKRCWSEFDFNEGCSKVFNGKKMRVADLANGLGLSPVLLTMESKENTNVFQSFVLMNEESVKTMVSLEMMNKKTICQVQCSKDEQTRDNNIILPTLEFVEFKEHPRFEEIMGEYTVLDESIEQELNNKKINFEAAANLFVGGLLYVESKIILILTVEIYPRAIQIDIHGESNYQSYPENLDKSNRFYKRIKITIIQGPDRGLSINKLAIGTEILNVLVTGSYILEPITDKVVTAGPSANPILFSCNFNNAQLLLRKESLRDYKNSRNEEFSTNNLRQLTSGISDISTYNTLRRTLFQNITLQPATVFTFHKYPLTGYGISLKNQTRKLSLFLALVAECIHESSGLFGLDDFSKLQNMNIKHEKLDPILLELHEQIQSSEDSKANIPEFLDKQKGLTDLVQSLSSNISKINQKVEANISSYLTET